MSTINKLNFDKMSRSDLEQLSRIAAQSIARIDSEVERRKKIKAEYRLEKFEYKWRINWYAFYNNVCASVESGVPVDATSLEAIKEKSLEAEPLDYGMIYRCPDCGELGYLYVGMYEGSRPDVTGYAVTCGNCSFTLADNTDSSKWAAWDTFHDWLIKNGFLDKSIKQPAQKPRKWL